MAKVLKSRAVTPQYMPQNQLSIEGFESPFERSLDPNNRWIQLSNLIPWDEICNIYLNQNKKSDTGRTPLSPRLVLGSIIIKHLCNLDDREVVLQITENPSLQTTTGIPFLINITFPICRSLCSTITSSTISTSINFTTSLFRYAFALSYG